MYETLQFIHSYWAYLVLLILIIAVVNAIAKTVGGKEYSATDFRISLFTLIVSHIQLIIGFIAFFASAQFKFLRENGMGDVMKESEIRLALIEHPLMMILAIVMITVGFSKHKSKTTDDSKFKTIAIYYGIALLFILSRIPWGQWFN